MSVNIKEWPGVPLKDRDIQSGKALTTRWQVKADYAWDTGMAMGTFLTGLKEGKILARQCDKCGRTVVPPRMFCEWCFRPTDRWVEVKDTGRVNTFSVSYVLWDATRVEKPTVPVVVEIDGCSPGVGFMHILADVGTTLEAILAKVKVGMAVKAVWKPAAERTGAITDIIHFVPREG
jgi:hypothetical protein